VKVPGRGGEEFRGRPLAGEGPVAASMTHSTPDRAPARPTPVITSTPLERDIATMSCPPALSTSTTWLPTLPVAPTTAIFLRACITSPPCWNCSPLRQTADKDIDRFGAPPSRDEQEPVSRAVARTESPLPGVAAAKRASNSSRGAPGGDGGRAASRLRMVSIRSCSASSSSKTAVGSSRPMRRMVRRRTASS
jgi:hypothetical protein